MDKDPTDRLAEVQRRLREIKSQKRGEVRWTVSTHTAELAIGAIEQDSPKPAPRSGKARRRKRTKRLL
ncbi:MAG TPA: hypothetical protein VGM82_21865 [Gemmatimonadaceae bacterium]